MNIKKNKQETYLELLRRISSKSNVSQRVMANDLGLSLGKLNYCLQALKAKGLIKFKKFEKNPNKIGYLYILTPKGIAAKAKITINFMKQKATEYNELKSEIKTEPKVIDKDLL